MALKPFAKDVLIINAAEVFQLIEETSKGLEGTLRSRMYEPLPPIHLEGFMVPKFVGIRGNLPKTLTGRINERELSIPARRVQSKSPFHSRPIN
jgi:hypothetical protein